MLSIRLIFGQSGAVSDLVNIGDSSRLKSWMLAAIVAVIGVNFSQMFGLFDVTESRIPYTNSLFSGHVTGWVDYCLALV